MSRVRWPDVRRLLTIYYARRHDWPILSPLGRDPDASRIQRGGVSRLLALICDVGTALDALPYEQRAAIDYRMSLWWSREQTDGAITRTRLELLAAERENNTGRAAELRSRLAELRAHQDRLTSELSRHERRKAYVEGMAALEVELVARDLYARATLGEGYGIGE